MIERTFTKEEMLTVLDDRERIISDEISDYTRWSVYHELIFRSLDGKTYRTSYSVGATEYQDESPWQYDKEVVAIEVVEVEKVVKVWEPAQ